MSDDLKQKILMFVAIFLTFMVVMNFMEQKRQAKGEREEWRQQQEQQAEPEAAESGEPATPATPVQPQPAPEDQIPGQDEPAPETQIGAEPGAEAESEPAPTRESSPPSTPEEPAARYQISVVRGQDEGRFEAVFSTRSAALTRFRLLGYVQSAETDEKHEVVVLDQLAQGQDSLLIASLNEIGLRGRNYRIVSAPRDARIAQQSREGDPETIEPNDRNELVFRTTAGAWEITKTYVLSEETAFGFRMTLGLRNRSAEAQAVTCRLVGPCGIVPDDTGRWGNIEAMSAALTEAGGTDTEVKRVDVNELLSGQREAEESGEPFADGLDERSRSIAWVGLKNRFFTSVLLVDDPAFTFQAVLRGEPVAKAYREEHKELAHLLEAHKATGAAVLVLKNQVGKSVPADGTLERGFRFYGGPADEERLAFDKRLGQLVSYTWGLFDPISRTLVKLLNMIASVVPNYGVAMILLTLLIKTLLHPLTRKGLHSSQKMQKVAPLVKEIQKKYKDQREKMHQEVMRIYREHGVSPMGGCLPMLIQLPIFIALFGAFSRGFALRQASFIPGWIDDLAAPDSVWNWGTPLPVLGSSLNLLPILYLILQIIQMSMQPKSEDPQIQQQQKMMKLMPIFFVFIFYSMPSGLVLYFTVSSVYTLVEHWLIKRGIDGTDQGQPAPAGAGAAAPSKEAKPGVAAGTGVKSAGGGKRKKKRKK